MGCCTVQQKPKNAPNKGALVDQQQQQNPVQKQNWIKAEKCVQEYEKNLVNAILQPISKEELQQKQKEFQELVQQKFQKETEGVEKEKVDELNQKIQADFQLINKFM